LEKGADAFKPEVEKDVQLGDRKKKKIFTG
jgi:hypothetical protein